MVARHRVTPEELAGLCPLCAGTGMMPRGAPPALRVACDACGGLGAVA